MKQKLHICTGRLLSAVISAVLSVTFIIQPESVIMADNDVTAVNNIVLFAQFGNSEDFMDNERTAHIINACNSEDTIHSLHTYIDTISYGQTQVSSYFPQLDGDTVQPYVLSQPLESYTSDSLALEILRNISIPEDIPLDGDNDGYIDNIILVIDGTAASQQDILWPHMSSLAYAGYEINGKKVNSYNIHNSGRLFGSVLRPIDVGVLCHEFLHSLGYPDLYRYDSSEEAPVGIWDIMATDSWYLQYPLAYMRASRSGWLETADITEDGTYTLSPVSSDSGNRIYLLKTPASDSEFFAVEFRQQGANAESMDYLCGTGMIVYRVNTLCDGNLIGDDDEIYVFRPTDSGLLSQANFGGEGRSTFIGSLDFADGINDGALTYSNGENSGIRIENITIDGDTLTFDVQFAQMDRQKQWYSVTNDISTNGQPNALELDVSESGIVYLAAVNKNGRSVGLYRLSETSYEPVSELSANGGMYEIKLAIAGETPYLLYNDDDYRAVLCSYDISSGKWQTIWRSETLAQYTDIDANGDEVYVCFTEGNYPSYDLRTICYADEKIMELGDSVIKSVCDPTLVCTKETVGVAYRDLSEKNIPKLAIFDNGKLTSISLSDTSAASLSAFSDGETITIAVTGNTTGLYKYKDNELTFTAYPELSGEPFSICLNEADRTQIVGIFTQNEYDYSLYCYNNGWEMLGGRIESQYILDPCVAVSENTIYTAYHRISDISGDDTVVIKTLQYGDNNILGDVNADGKFTVSDVVLLEKWLLTVPDTKLNDWKAADLCEDNKLDVFDLCLMKQALLNK